MNVKFQGQIVHRDKVLLIELLTPLEKQSRESDPVSELVIRTVQKLDFQKNLNLKVFYLYTEMNTPTPHSQQNILKVK